MPKKILIADDSVDTREMIKTALEFNSYQVWEVDDGSKVLDKAIEVKPDLIVLDISMPNLDGYSTTLLLRKNKDTANIPVIISSGHGKMAEIFKKDSAAKISGFIEKPYLQDDLLKKVKAIIGQ